MFELTNTYPTLGAEVLLDKVSCFIMVCLVTAAYGSEADSVDECTIAFGTGVETTGFDAGMI